MNWLDMIIMGVMLFFLIRGIYRGFFRELCSLLGVVVGIWLANSWQPELTLYLKKYTGQFFLLPLVSFAAIFIVVVTLANIAGWALKAAFQKASMGWVDRSMAVSIALLKGLVVTYLFIVLLIFCLPAKSSVIAGSKFTPWIVSSYQRVVGLLSPDFYGKWKKKFLGQEEAGKKSS